MPPGPNHSSQTARSVQNPGTGTPGPYFSATYWQTRTYLSLMPVLDRSLVSLRISKIASRTSSVMLGCPPPGRTHRPSMHPAGPLSFHAAAIRSSVRSLTFPSPSTAASSPPRACSSAALARRRCPSVVDRGS